MIVHVLLLISLIFQIIAAKNSLVSSSICTCDTPKTIYINYTNNNAFISPRNSSNIFCSAFNCSWVIEIDYGSPYFALEIIINWDLFLISDNNLTIFTCDSNKTLFPTILNNEYFGAQPIFTQEETVCIHYYSRVNTSISEPVNQAVYYGNWSLNLTLISIYPTVRFAD